MSHFDPRIINSNPKSISGTPILIGIGFVFIIILLWASVAYVPPGNVGVLVYFGRVTGETLPAGTHFVLSIQDQPRFLRTHTGAGRAHFHAVHGRPEPGD